MTDELWSGGPCFVQRESVFKLGTDSVLLAHFVGTQRARRGLDLGSGCGVLAVLLARQNPQLIMDCVDISAEAVSLTAENTRRNGLDGRVHAVFADIRHMREAKTPELGSAGQYDLIAANPPYFPVGGGKRHAAAPIANARDESLCSLQDLAQTAAYFLRWGGQFALVHRPERLAEIITTLNQNGLEPKRLRLVSQTAAAPPTLILLEARRGGAPGLIIEPPLVLQDESGGESAELRKIYHR